MYLQTANAELVVWRNVDSRNRGYHRFTVDMVLCLLSAISVSRLFREKVAVLG